MLSWIIQISLISIIFIFLVHHIFCFLKDTLTVPKMKDLVTLSSKKYENIYSTIANNQELINNKEYKNEEYKNEVSYTEIDLLPANTDLLDINSNTNTNTNIHDLDMKDELKNFLKTQLNTNTNSNTNDINFIPASSNENYSYI
jgi:hypothetical protein